jgi:hypothetical protein
LSANESQTSSDESSLATNTLDAEYKHVPASLYDVINPCESLHIEKNHQINMLLPKYEHLFDGTSGKFNMEPISLQLMDPNCKPGHARAYTVPKLMKH